MLNTLKIKNIALIENLTIEFDKGLNVLTGETGAGKSIIIDSLNFVLGARTDRTLIRSGENNARVDAVFTVDNNTAVEEFFKANDFDYDGEILISRSMNTDGKSNIWLNGNPITAGMLKELTSNLVDIYGQQEQVSLLSNSKQLQLLDNFCGKDLKKLQAEYLEKYSQIKKINKSLQELGGDSQIVEREKDYLSFVINEIESQNLSEDEENDLKEKVHLFSNIEKIMSGANMTANALNSAEQYINQAISSLSTISSFDSSMENLHERLKSQKIELDDITETINEYLENLDFSETEFDKLDARLDTYKSLQKKYGGTTENVLQFLNESKTKLDRLVNSEQYILKLQDEKVSVLKSALDLAKQINNIRQKTAQELQEKLKQNLVYLGMPSATIYFDFNNMDYTEDNLTSTGVGGVQIMFSANLGQQAKLLSKVASGGEMSRVMLAIKSVLAESDSISTMIFDEIDSGISGQIAQAVSEKIAQISRHHQVLVITHTIQIASMADAHFKVRKFEQDGKTVSNVEQLDENSRVDEIARFISADASSTLAKQSAMEIIKKQDLFKQKL